MNFALTQLKDGYHYSNSQLWLGAEATRYKHGCQEPASATRHVGEVNSQKRGTGDTIQWISTVLLL